MLFDATATEVGGGTRILSTSWNFGNGRSVRRTGAPRIEEAVYATEGIYDVSLTLRTNENTTIRKELEVEVRDPIARIRTDSGERVANVGDEMRFSASTNYSDLQLRYFWEVIDLETREVVLTSSQRTISYAFPAIGKYQIRLRTTTPLAKEDTDSVIIEIEPKDPIVGFQSRIENSELPNVVTFDATQSYDPDTFTNSNLQYEWSINGNAVILDNPSRNGAMGQYTFTTRGTHRILLRVTNQSGRTVTKARDITIDSLLSVRLATTPRIARVGDAVSFIADAPNALVYEWNFGDGEDDTTNIGRISHTYKQAGSYRITLRVRAANSREQNSITREVYITEANAPFAVIDMSQNSEPLFPTSGACGDRPAYIVTREYPVQFSGAESVNVEGRSTNLDSVWQYAGNTSAQNSFSYRFDELGCFPVSLTVIDKETGKRSTRSTYVSVRNVPPEFSAIQINADTEQDPVVVNVSATNARDPDGVIVSYLWYYYTDNDPEPQDFRITRTPQTSFVIPRVTGTYYFGVVLEDSNGAKVNSMEVRDERYSLRMASDNINTPLLQLSTSSNSIFA